MGLLHHKAVTKVLWTPGVGSIRLLEARRVSGSSGGEFEPGGLQKSEGLGRFRALLVMKWLGPRK